MMGGNFRNRTIEQGNTARTFPSVGLVFECVSVLATRPNYFIEHTTGTTHHVIGPTGEAETESTITARTHHPEA